MNGSNKMSKKCSTCKEEINFECFGKLKSSKDGYRYDCCYCRKKYREKEKDKIKEKQKEYFEKNKETLLSANKLYRENNKEAINKQRKQYRNRDDIKEHIKIKNKEYLPIKKEKIKERRKVDVNFKMSEILRSKIHKILNNKPTSFLKYLGCDLEWFKKWIEFRFDKNMNWDNLGKYWQIDHILPISRFDMTNENDIRICFHWTNLQPLESTENRQKYDNFILHYYFNNIINVNRFNSKNARYLGYQIVNESLRWLRLKLRYGKNPSYDSVKTDEIDNPQPSL